MVEQQVAARIEYEAGATIRREAMAELKKAVSARFSQADIARWVGCSPSWVGQVLRGNYPWYGGAYLPKNIRVTLENLGISAPDCLKIH
jgi:hypothetical protein